MWLSINFTVSFSSDVILHSLLYNPVCLLRDKDIFSSVNPHRKKNKQTHKFTDIEYFPFPCKTRAFVSLTVGYWSVSSEIARNLCVGCTTRETHTESDVIAQVF